MCRRLKDAGAEAQIATRTGLLLDPYFSASKIAWLLDHIPGAGERAERGELAFGTADWFLWRRLAAGGTDPPSCNHVCRTAASGTHPPTPTPRRAHQLDVPRRRSD